MKYTLKYILLLLTLAVHIYCAAQDVPLGGWKDYISYRNGLSVTIGQNVIYCVAGSGLFSYNTTDNSVDRLNKVTGLSDVSPSVARFNSFSYNSTNYNVLVIGYTDGNIDLLNNKTITNVPDLKNSNVQGSKSINCVCFNNNYAYVGCGQGILQMDLAQDVILNTFYFGPSGSAINVKGISICNDTIFAVTNKGVYLASLSDPNLNNYNDWHPVGSQLPYGTFTSIATVGDSVFVDWSSANTTYIPYQDTVFVYSNGHWTHYKNLQGTTGVNSLESARINGKNYLIASTQYTVNTFDTKGNQVPPQIGNYIFGNNAEPVNANDAVRDANNNAWVADNTYGLVKVSGLYNNAIICTPQGPYSNQVFTMAVNKNNLWVVPGGFDANYAADYNTTGLSALQSGTWNYISNPTGIYDLTAIAIDPWNPLHVYTASWGGGLIEYLNNSLVNVWDSSNSTIQNIDVANDRNFRIGGVAYDTIGNVWVTNSLAASKYLSVRKPSLSWQAFDFGSFMAQAATVTTVMITQSQAKWMLFPGIGILVYQDNGTFAAPNNSNTHLITAQTGNGALPGLNIYCMAQDQNGSIWVGTDQRVIVFYSPDNVLDGSHDWDAQPVYVTQNGYTQYLMQNQVTTAIAIDGANRKWIGTQAGGVFLMSADGTQQIYNFTSTNSPLLSNNIQSIVINPTNGEVFFATDKGIVSYKGSATEGLTSFGKVYAYPDPVPHDYTGPVAIKNLVTNADVKITTVNGELVYHTVALGGQAIWNGTNFDGKRVQTGVYLIFCASPDGSQTLVSKLLFIN